MKYNVQHQTKKEIHETNNSKEPIGLNFYPALSISENCNQFPNELKLTVSTIKCANSQKQSETDKQ